MCICIFIAYVYIYISMSLSLSLSLSFWEMIVSGYIPDVYSTKTIVTSGGDSTDWTGRWEWCSLYYCTLGGSKNSHPGQAPVTYVSLPVLDWSVQNQLQSVQPPCDQNRRIRIFLAADKLSINQRPVWGPVGEWWSTISHKHWLLIGSWVTRWWPFERSLSESHPGYRISWLNNMYH